MYCHGNYDTAECRKCEQKYVFKDIEVNNYYYFKLKSVQHLVYYIYSGLVGGKCLFLWLKN